MPTDKDSRKTEELLEKQETSTRLNDAVSDNDAASEPDMMTTSKSGMNCDELSTYKIPPEAAKLIPEPMAKKYNAIPLSIQKNSLRIALADPDNLRTLEELSSQIKMRIVPVIATIEDIKECIARNYTSYAEIEQQFTDVLSPIVTNKGKTAEDVGVKAPAVFALNMTISQAINDRASDIHIEPQENALRLRFRIDGVMNEVASLPSHALTPIISRLKVLANMDIADHRPQDGQFSFKVGDKEVDIRVATIPTAWGEMGTLRILDKSFAIRSLSKVGFLPENLSQYEKMLKSPFGMILVSGPTGSGKTTTLYASINSLDRKQLNIITVEDPIEYHLDDINQIQVNPRAKLTFSTGLRAIMRHDPDVILVGEIRDPDTAKIAVQAATTGHLVLASVHANDTVGVLSRMVDLEVDQFLVASALIGVVAQRMVRRVCPHCQSSVPVSVTEERLYCKELGEERKEFLVGSGCNACANTGYMGRMPVFEILRMSNETRRLVSAGASAEQIRANAMEEGMISMQHDGMLKVKANLTTPSEVLRNAFFLG